MLIDKIIKAYIGKKRLIQKYETIVKKIEKDNKNAYADMVEIKSYYRKYLKNFDFENKIENAAIKDFFKHTNHILKKK